MDNAGVVSGDCDASDANIQLAEPVTELKIEVDLTADMTVYNPFDFFTEDHRLRFRKKPTASEKGSSGSGPETPNPRFPRPGPPAQNRCREPQIASSGSF